MYKKFELKLKPYVADLHFGVFPDKTVVTLRLRKSPSEVFSGVAWMHPNEEWSKIMGEQIAFDRMAETLAVKCAVKRLKDKKVIYNDKIFESYRAEYKGRIYAAFFKAEGYWGESA